MSILLLLVLGKLITAGMKLFFYSIHLNLFSHADSGGIEGTIIFAEYFRYGKPFRNAVYTDGDTARHHALGDCHDRPAMDTS
ncbi:MAG: hypothetical protein JW832_07225 [Deltaproteobacteria bacterium]|nr:hypothetical protein [Deltaproteobacteria bacterium]